MAQAPCYFPDGTQAIHYFPCDPNAYIVQCCPQDWTCYSNSLCVVQDALTANLTYPNGTIIRGTCTDPIWSDAVCGEYCLQNNLGSAEIIQTCGNGSFCCASDQASGKCNCTNDNGTFSVGSGIPQTTINVTNTAPPYGSVGPSSPAKLSHKELLAIIIGIVLFTVTVLLFICWKIPWKKNFRALRRPLDLFRLYGCPGLALLLFGSRTTWRTEAYVLGKENDDDALNFKKSVQDECTMISVAAAIVAQISVTALSLDNLSQTHWIATAFLLFGFISSLMAVYYATTQQRTLGRLLQPTQIRGWIRGQVNSRWKSKAAHRLRTDPKHYLPIQSDSISTIDDIMKSCFTPSVASVVTMSAPQILLSASLLTLILGIAIYFGFIWSRHIDLYAQENGSRNVMAMFLVSTGVCFMIYSLSGLIQDGDTSTEKTILLDYLNDYARENPDVASQWGLGNDMPLRDTVQRQGITGSDQRSDQHSDQHSDQRSDLAVMESTFSHHISNTLARWRGIIKQRNLRASTLSEHP